MEKYTEFRYKLVGLPGHCVLPESNNRNLFISEELRKLIETKVRDWLNNEGAESLEKYCQLMKEDGSCDYMDYFRFTRKEVLVRGISNEWLVYHIAHDDRFGYLISSDIKCRILLPTPEPCYTLKNSVNNLDEKIYDWYKDKVDKKMAPQT